MVPIFTGHVRTDGKWEIDDPEGLRAEIARLAGKRIEVVVRRQHSQRSSQQNRYYWGVIVDLLGKELGYDPDEMHDALRAKFLTTPAEGDGLPHIKSTTELSTSDMEDYHERIRRWADEFLHIYIPLPNEVDV